MAYENEINFPQISSEIQNDLISNSLNVTQTPLTEDVANSTVQVTTEIDGVPVMRRISVGVLMADATSAAAQALAQAQAAQEAAASAQTASTAAMTSAQNADNKASECQSAIEDFQETLDDYLSETDQQVKSRLIELGQMAQSGVMNVTVDSIQLFDDFKLATGYTGTYNDFLILLGQGGGGTITVDTAMSSTSINPVQNKVISTALVGKQDVIEFLTAQDINAIINLNS